MRIQGQYIKSVAPNGPADLSGVLPGDHVLAIDGADVQNENHHQVGGGREGGREGGRGREGEGGRERGREGGREEGRMEGMVGGSDGGRKGRRREVPLE